MIRKLLKRTFMTVMSLLMAVTLLPQMGIEAQASTGVDLDMAVPSLSVSYVNSAKGNISYTAGGNSILVETSGYEDNGNPLYSYTKITFTNNKTVPAVLCFDYQLTGAGSLIPSVGEMHLDGLQHNFQQRLAAGQSFVLEVRSPQAEGDTNRFQLVNLTLLEEVESSTKFIQGAYGTYTADGVSVGSVGLTKTKMSYEGTAVSAVADAGYKFFGWQDVNTKEYVSLIAETVLRFDTDRTIQPVFIKSDTPSFMVGKQYYTDFQEALDAAGTLASSTNTNVSVVLMSDGTIYGDYVIPRMVTLLIPFNSANTLYRKMPENTHFYEKPTAYRTLTMAEGSSITVEAVGAISVSGKNCAASGSWTTAGSPTGPVGFIRMEKDSKITINSNANLYAWGFITGEGEVVVKSGGAVYENIQVSDFRGGSATTAMSADLTYGVFPFNQYYVQNVEVKETIEQGAKVITVTSIFMSGMAYSSAIDFIGTEGSLFTISKEGSYITKEYIPSTDRLELHSYGDMLLNGLSMSLSDTGINIDSQLFVLPLTHNLELNIHEGSISVAQDVCLLPGVVVNVDQDAQLHIQEGYHVYVYDMDQWNTKYHHRYVYSPVEYAPSRKENVSFKDYVDVRINMNGTLHAEGHIYTTNGGADVVSDEGTGRIIMNSSGTAKSVTYQAEQTGSDNRQIVYHSINVTSAKLHNEDGSYTLTSNAEPGDIFYFNGAAGKWEEANDVVVHFDANKGSGTMADQNVAKEDLSTALLNPNAFDRAGYSFVEWNTKADGTGVVLNDLDNVHNVPFTDYAATLYAQWKADGYKVSYLANGGTGESILNDHEFDETFKVASNPFVNTGYEFDGWNTKADGTGTAYQANVSVSNLASVKDETVKLYAQWKPVVYTIDYDLAGGTAVSNPDSYTIESSALMIQNPVKEGYEFAGWTGTDLSAPEKNLILAKGSTGNKSYTATWKAKEYSYSVLYQSSSGKPLGTDSVRHEFGQTYEVIPAVIAGYEIPASQMIEWNSATSKTIRFVYKPISYSIVYDLNGGRLTGTNPSTYTVESPEIKLLNPTKSGFEFAGWIGSGITEAKKDVYVEAGSTGNLSFTAQWKGEEVAYTVNHYQMDLDGMPVLTLTQTLYETAGNTVYPEVKSFEGFVSPQREALEVTLEGSVLEYFYERESYELEVNTGKGIASIGIENPKDSYLFGETVKVSAAPEAGYRFLSWSGDSNSSSAMTEIVMKARKMVLNASAEPIQYQISYHLDKGSFTGEAVTSFNIESDALQLPVAYKEGYDFAGWMDSYGRIVEEIAKGTVGDLHLTAQWTAKKYTVTWKNDDGTVLETDTDVAYGSMPKYDGETPVKPNGEAQFTYVFAGWTPDVTKVTGNVIYTAKYVARDANTTTWRVLFMVDNHIYDLNYYAQGEAVRKPADPVKEGYTFLNWSPDDVPSVMNGRDYLFNEVWAVNLYSVLYAPGADDVQGEMVQPVEEFVYDEKYNLTQCGFIRPGYEFVGWKDDFGNFYYDQDEIYNLSSKDGDVITLTAQWKAKEYTISFNTDGGSAVDSITQQYGTPVNAPADPVKDGYTFEGWNIRVPETMPSYDMTLTAVWAVNEYEIQWDVNADDVIDAQDVVTKVYHGEIPEYIGETPVKPSTAQYDYVFRGWSPDLTTAVNHATYKALYAEVIRKYNISWKTEEGVTVNSEDYGVVPTYPKSTPTKSSDEKYSYVFAGWIGNGVTVPTAAENLPVVAGEAAYEAVFTPVPVEYTIVFDSNGGTAVDSLTAGYGTAIAQPAAPEKVGYTFTGWDKEVPATMPVGGLTLTAQWKINQYTIAFDTDGGSAVASITQDYNSEIKAPADPVKSGYTFDGWSIAIPGTMPAENLTLRANWKVNQYTIVFDTDGGSDVASITQNYNTAVAAPADPVKTGYTFAGWDKEVPSVMPVDGMKLTALWTVNQYTVTFLNEDGSEYAKSIQDFDSEIDLPETPSKTGYAFGGWVNGQNALPKYMPAENLTVKPVWNINQYTIVFDTYGGNDIAPLTLDYGAAVIKPADPVKTGYTFIGWDTEIPSTMPAETMTITAQWKINQYTVTFDSNGGSAVAPLTLDYRNIVEAPAAPVKTGYSFAGWLPALPERMPAEDISVTAQWKINTYRITFQTSGSPIETIVAEYGAPVVQPADPERPGYVFAGWTTEFPETMPANDVTMVAKWEPLKYNIEWDLDGNGTVDKITVAEYNTMPVAPEKGSKNATAEYSYEFIAWSPELQKVTDSSVKKYTALFRQIPNTYTITFKTNGGSEVASQNVAYGSAINAPADPVFPGYTFAGWEGLPETMPAKNVVAVAQWKPVQYKIEFTYPGMDTIVADYGAVVSKPADPVMKGYTFVGWSPEFPETMPLNGLILSPVWKVNQYTITFDTDGGNAIPSITQDYGTSVVQPADPVKEGYTFVKWSDHVPGSMPNSNLTLKAIWQPNLYTITFKDTDLQSLTAEYNSVLTQPADPVKTGYTFTGWTPAFPEKMPLNGLVLTAGWKINQYTITFNTNGGTMIPAVTQNYGTAVAKPADPVRKDYVFIGWDKEIPSSMPGENITITAQWKYNYTGFTESGNDLYYVVNGEKVMTPGLFRIVKENGEINYIILDANGKVNRSASVQVSADLTNGLLPEDTYTVDEQGVILHDPDTSKTGIHEESGKKYFYIDGIKVHQGVILVGDYYYYAGNGGALYVNRTFVDIKRTNGLVGTGRYNFDEQGRMYNGTSIPKPQDPVTDEAIRVKGTDRFATSLEVADALKEELGVDKFNAVILVNGRDFADALAGSYLAAEKGAPILMVDNKNASKMSTIENYIAQNMVPNGTVYILGGEAAVPEFAAEALSEYNVKRLKGKNRYGTNLAILDEVGVNAEEILVANAKNFADSLSASATGKPMLLVGATLNADQKAFIEAHPNCTFTILGGTGAVSAEVETQLRGYGSVRRLSGTNRYETSVKIAEAFFNDADAVVLAYARNFPDGLAGGPLAYAMKAPLILVDTDKNVAHDDFAVSFATTRNIKSGYVLGGSGLVKDETVKDIIGKVPTMK